MTKRELRNDKFDPIELGRGKAYRPPEKYASIWKSLSLSRLT